MVTTEGWAITLMYLLVLFGLTTPTLSQWLRPDGTNKENKLEHVGRLAPGVQDHTSTSNQTHPTDFINGL